MANAMTYGWINLRDVKDRLITDVGVTQVQTAIAQTIAQHNQEITAVFGNFVRQTTDFRQVYRTLGSNRLQPLDENGRSVPVKGGASYQLEWPLQRAGTAWGKDYESNLKMTVAHAAEQNDLMLTGDAEWMRDHVLAALFYNGAGWTFDDEVRGNLTIKGLANGDTQLYDRVGGAPAATAQHYIAQAAAIADATNPYPTIYSTLKSYPGNTGQVVALIPTGLVATTQALATFMAAPDPNVRLGTGNDSLIGTLGGNWPGRTIGYVEGVWVREWTSLPANYIVATVEGADAPVTMRQDELAALQGFNLVATREDFPYTEFQYRRKAGFGAWNRVGALVYRVNNGAYAIPTNYTSPMP